MNVYANNVQFGFNFNNLNNYSDSSDSSTGQSSPQMNNNYYEQYANNENKDYTQVQAYESFDQEMSDESFHLNEAVLSSKNLNTPCFKPPVNRGGRKQVKIGTTKRNARERSRVRFINTCFEVLRDHIPFDAADEQKNRKLSKVETLKYATLYIKQLSELLETGHVDPKQDSNEINMPKPEIQMNTSSICYNNININIYENRCGNTDMYSPTSTSSTSSSSSSSSLSTSSTSSLFNQYHSSYSNVPSSVGIISSPSCYLNYSNRKAVPTNYFNYVDSQPNDWRSHMNMKW